MKFVIEIELDNAAFQPDFSEEVSRILQELADDALEDSIPLYTSLRDANGNRVGFAKLVK